MTEQPPSDLFDEVFEFPRSAAQELYESLVGLDAEKERLSKHARALLRPADLLEWSERNFQTVIPLVGLLIKRLPLFVFEGDVGAGKTALAETFGDEVAQTLGIPMVLYRLSLSARGTGAVGQMTELLTTAFRQIEDFARAIAREEGRPKKGVILLIDEADALAQSRELSQMHHEDRAGVDALIRGVDRIGSGGLPVLVVMCTNRPEALDPAIRRRAADIFTFGRPGLEERVAVLAQALHGTPFTAEDIRSIAEATGESDGRDYGCTYSDIVQRLLPNAVLDAFPQSSLSIQRVLQLARELTPTPPFRATERD